MSEDVVVPTAYCNLINDSSAFDECQGNAACMRKEMKKCLQAHRYVKDTTQYEKTVNQVLKELGFYVQTVIVTHHTDFESQDSIMKADYIRAQTKKGLPFIIYLDSKGEVETESCTTEHTTLTDTSYVSESLLSAGYKITTPVVRGVAFFSPEGLTVSMFDNKMAIVTLNHAYNVSPSSFSSPLERGKEGKGKGDKLREELLDIAVPYPVIPLSEICHAPDDTDKRISMVLEPLRRMILERTVKCTETIQRDLSCIPTKYKNITETIFCKLEELEESAVELRKTYDENEAYCCKHRRECQCELEKQTRNEIVAYNIGMRERNMNEIISLYSTLTLQLRSVHNLLASIECTQKLLDERYSRLNKVMVDPNSDWSEKFRR